MMLGGDEFRRTQGGNNNAYCQDNEISWFDWSLLHAHQEIYRFVRGMIRFRQAHAVLRSGTFYTHDGIQWFGPALEGPDWEDADERRLGCLIAGQEGPDLYLLFNASHEEARFALPESERGIWHLVADTSHEAPEDIRDVGAELALTDKRSYTVSPRAAAILVAHTMHRVGRRAR